MIVNITNSIDVSDHYLPVKSVHLKLRSSGVFFNHCQFGLKRPFFFHFGHADCTWCFAVNTLVFFFFFFNTVCGLVVPDLINYFPNLVGPDQTSHTMASDLGHIVCFSFFFFFDGRNTGV